MDSRHDHCPRPRLGLTTPHDNVNSPPTPSPRFASFRRPVRGELINALNGFRAVATRFDQRAYISTAP
ncbi:hypothetical protein ACH4LK_36400 [Streptomyces lydicus]|uniref:hypothetical protein n=1 Tax=Streptomyces lydicus TaxID=47763 RepID=UPI0037AFDBFB